MDNLHRFSVPTNLMADIAVRMPQTGRLSPFWPFCQAKADELRPLPGTIQGVTGPQGELTAEAAAILASVAEVNGFVRIVVSAEERFAEKIVYFPTAGSPVLLVPGQKTFDFTVPAPTVDLVAGLAEQLGVSAAAIGDFAAEMSAAEALVLAAVIDLERRHILTELAAGRMPAPLAADAAGVEIALSGRNGGARWLAPLVAKLTGQDKMPAVDKVLADLYKTGLLRSGTAGYLPSDAVWEIAEKLLLVDRLCAVSAGREVNGTVVVTGFTCVIGGIANLLCVEAADGRVRLKTPSVREVLAEIEYLITTPEALRPLADAIPAGPPTGEPSVAATRPEEPAGIVCQKCGALIPAGKSFCGQCGNLAEEKKQTGAPAPAYCRECGQPLVSRTKYCTNCGTLI